MNLSFSDSNLDADLQRAVERKGYELLTPIQQAVLDIDTSTADLRITSITGSGKTLAIGFALRGIAESCTEGAPRTGPRALVVVPTRELAKQVQTELAWLFEERKWRIESVTGGTSIRDERRALRCLPMVLVATPGRLLDHLTNGALNLGEVATVVLDEADRMLDMGFQEDLQSILDALPKERQTHMASATFCDAVGRLANRYQRSPIHVQGTPLGKANEDIDHVMHAVHADQKPDAVVNLLLASPDEQAIVFARTRADVASITRDLSRAGFRAVSLSGEMDQPARDRALATFRRGDTRVLVATDVAARGLDIQGVTQIIHFDAPTDPDGYIHRSGRTGRAGKKGTSHLLVVPAGLGFVKMILKRAGTKFNVAPIPTAESLRAQQDERLLAELSDTSNENQPKVDARQRALAEKLCASGDAVEMVSRLLMRVESKGIVPREIFSPRVEQGAEFASRKPARLRKGKSDRNFEPAAPWQKGKPQRNFEQPAWQPQQQAKPERNSFAPAAPPWQQAKPERSFEAAPPWKKGKPARAFDQAPWQGETQNGYQRPSRSASNRDDVALQAEPGYGAFHVTWGETQGADPRRLLAIVCRKGKIRSQDVGAIRIGATSSVVQVREQVAAAFAEAAKSPDRRDPMVRIAPLRA